MEELVTRYNASLHVIYWDRKNINSTRFEIRTEKSIVFFERSTTSDEAILNLLVEKDPQIIVVSGWMDKGYISACKKYKSKNPTVKIIAGIDDLWLGTFRQRLGQVYYYLFYRRLFDFMWVAGKPQFSYAQHFGYSSDKIICNLLSADSSRFKSSGEFSKRFVFVGRFDPVKSLDKLINAYSRLPVEKQKEWPLYLIGDGEMRGMIEQRNNPNIIVIPFLQPDDLQKELAKGGVGCLTSSKDQWGVAVHEYALMGYPLLLSSGCGASTEFLIFGYNGFSFERDNERSLYDALNLFTELSEKELHCFATRSISLGNRIKTEQSAASLMSVIYKYNNDPRY